MGWVTIGARPTFFPPFVNERFGTPPYWACTFTAGLLGANVAKYGKLPATQAEILALAKASGDPTLTSGSNTDQLAAALKARYGLTIHLEDVSDAEVQRRLGTGWVLVAGCWYGKLPLSFRRWSPSFTGGHRVLLVGFAGTRTRILDPMAAKDPTYAGEWIEWTDFRKAFWSDDQAWLLEGELMQQQIFVTASFSPPRVVTIAPGTTVQGWLPTGPGRKATFPTGSSAHFDMVATISQLPDPKKTPHGGGFIRCVDGIFAGQYLVSAQPGLTADISAPATGAVVLAARQAEYDRIKATADATVVLPARPA